MRGGHKKRAREKCVWKIYRVTEKYEWEWEWVREIEKREKKTEFYTVPKSDEKKSLIPFFLAGCCSAVRGCKTSSVELFEDFCYNFNFELVNTRDLKNKCQKCETNLICVCVKFVIVIYGKWPSRAKSSKEK